MGRRLAAMLVCILGAGCATPRSTRSPTDQLLRSVTVYVQRCGSGWLLDERLVVTNAHVAACANQRTYGHAEVVFSDGLRVIGHILWPARPRFVDLAIIELTESVPRAAPRLGDPAALARGATVLTMGHTELARRFTIHSYLVLAQPAVVDGGLDGVIVLDNPARHGESGSPVMTTDGEIVGVLFASTHLNAYAVPVRPYLTDILGQLSRTRASLPAVPKPSTW